MKTSLNEYLGDSEWHFTEHGWDPSSQSVEESLYALGNGYLGSRGILEELPKGVQPGTFFAGLYDKTSSQVQELINAPNPINLQLSIGGEKLDVSAMDILDHERILDIQKGLLYRRTLFQTTVNKNQILYESLRFFSMANPHICCIRVMITPLTHQAKFTVKSVVDTSVSNAGLVTEGAKRHFFIHEFSKHQMANYLCTKTLEHEVLIAYASEMQVSIGSKTSQKDKRMFTFTLKKDQTATLTKFTSYLTSNDTPAPKVKSRSLQILKNATAQGFEKLLEKHCNSWKKLWDQSDIKIEGDHDLLRALRYNIYQLLSTGSKNTSSNASIGARCLSGEGYRGHIFWDVEIFILPFFIFTFPDIAKNLLLYRYKRLDAARKNAKHRGYSGAMFPWESAHEGDDVTPTWHKDFDGRMIKIHTMQQEHHITADIAYAIWQYYQATNDKDFMINYGIEILLETARFWNSRVSLDKKRHCYVIDHIIGPDEFHESVNNNFFTNQMAQWNLAVANGMVNFFLKKSPEKTKRLLKKLKITQKELKKWVQTAENIYLPTSNKNGILEQFEGFYKRKKYPLPEIDSTGLPGLPTIIPLEQIGKSQYVKQADVILLFFLFPDLYSQEIAKNNYEYYESKTLHKSSLSASIHAAMAARLGFQDQAYRYLKISAHADLENIYRNTQEGIHAASLGGTWQAFIKGFCGMMIKNGELSFNPRLPIKWKKIQFQISWKGGIVAIDINSKTFKIRWKGKGSLPIYLFDEHVKLKPGVWMSFPRVDSPIQSIEIKGVY